MFTVLACSGLFAIKGGQHGPLIKKLIDRAWDHSFKLGWIVEKATDGTLVSSVLFGILMGSPLAALAWLTGVCLSVGEEIGSIGGFRGNWRPEGRRWGWRAGVIRGVFLGAMLALAIPDHSTGLILAGAMFPLCAFIGVSLEQLRTGAVSVSWRWFEWIYGGVLGLGVVYG